MDLRPVQVPYTAVSLRHCTAVITGPTRTVNGGAAGRTGRYGFAVQPVTVYRNIRLRCPSLILRSAHKGHLNSARHFTAIDILRQRAQDAQEQQKRLQDTYSGPSIGPVASGHSVSGSSCVGMFDNPLRAPSPALDFPWFPEAPIPPALDLIPEYNSETELENLSHQILKMLWEAEEQDLLGERADQDDITAPSFMRDEGVLLKCLRLSCSRSGRGSWR